MQIANDTLLCTFSIYRIYTNCEVVINVGFIGIGQMGQYMSKRIFDAGYNLIVHDLKKEAANHLLEQEAQWHNTLREVAESCQIVR